jgi:hypothetical protein
MTPPWTALLVMLLLMRMCHGNKYSGRIRKEGGITKGNIKSLTIATGWFEGVKQVDRVANWSVKVL